MRLPPDENLPEVVPDSSPEVIPKNVAAQYTTQLNDQNPKYPVILDDTPKFVAEHEVSPPTAAVSPYAETLVAGPSPIYPPPELIAAPAAEKKIWGMEKKKFWIIVILVVVVLVATLGGGLGGGLAARNSKASASPDSAGVENEDLTSTSPSETTSTTPTTPSDESSSTSASSEPSETIGFLNETIPNGKFAFQAWSKKDFKGEVSQIFRDEGLHNLGFNANSYIWLPNDTVCCVTFCDDLSFRCDEFYRREASGAFPMIYISCEGVRKAHACTS